MPQLPRMPTFFARCLWLACLLACIADVAAQTPRLPWPLGPAATKKLTPDEAIKFVAELGPEVVRIAKDEVIDTEWGKLRLTAAKQADIERYLPLLAEELRLLGKPLLQRLDVKQIVLCGGMKLGEVVRGAIPRPSASVMYYDVAWGNWSPVYQRRCVHHELFHYLDERDDGQLWRDPAFAKLNPKDFKYGNGGASAQGDSSASLPSETHPGFLTPYARSGVEEDKAEVFSFLLVDPTYVAQRCATDKVLQQKVDFVRALLLKYCAEFGAEAWPKPKPEPAKKAKPAPPKGKAKQLVESPR